MITQPSEMLQHKKLLDHKATESMAMLLCITEIKTDNCNSLAYMGH
jgi:hypothetical protein